MYHVNCAKIVLVIAIVAVILSTIGAVSDANAEKQSRPSRGVNSRSACACNRMYRPICGSDGKTYGNDCTFRCAAKAKSSLTIKQRSPCDVGPDYGEIEEIEEIASYLL